MSHLTDLIERAKARGTQPMFSNYDELRAFQQREAAKDFERLQREQNQQRIKNLMDRAGVAPEHQHCSFENYTCSNEGQQRAKRIAQAYANRFGEMQRDCRSMVFYGTTGTGKNHLASAIANQLLQKGRSVVVTKVIDLMSRFRAAYRRDSTTTEADLVHSFTKLDLLVIDEVGMSHGSTDEVVQLNRIIDERTNHGVPTIILTNLSPDQLTQTLGARVMDRLTAHKGVMMEFNWESYRRGAAA